MTDISDQDRRAAREWADEMSGHPILNENARAAVRYVLATVDAPAPTLADELRDLTVQWPLDPATMDVTKPRLDRLTTLADRVEQIEQERDDLARARESQEKALHEHGRLLSEARAERDEARAEVASLTEDLAGSGSEVVRLRAEVRSLQFDKLEGITAFGWMEQAKWARSEVERLTEENRPVVFDDDLLNDMEQRAL